MEHTSEELLSMLIKASRKSDDLFAENLALKSVLSECKRDISRLELSLNEKDAQINVLQENLRVAKNNQHQCC